MKCEKCQDRGFTEENHGLTMVLCDCEIGKKKRVELGMPDPDGGQVLQPSNIITIESEPIIPLSEMATREVAGANGIPWREDDDAIYVGLCFQLDGIRNDEFSIDELWVMAKEASLEEMEFPRIVDMPCGNTQWFTNRHSILSLPIEDMPCYCGNPNHYIVRFIDARDDSSSGAEPANTNTGSRDTSQPKRTSKPKAKKKARARDG